MEQEQKEAQTPELTSVQGLPIPNGAKKYKGGYLMPPWPKGTSGNASGKTSDGINPKTHAIEARLLAQLGAPSAKHSTKTWSERIVDGWLKAAAKGDPAARRDILERLYPVPKDAQQGRMILEGLKLELTPQGAYLTMARSEALSSGQNSGSLLPCGDVDASVTTQTAPAVGAGMPPDAQGSATVESAPTAPMHAQGQLEGPS